MKSNQIKQAFESVQADSDLADRVLYAAAGEPLRRKGHAKPLYVAVILPLPGETMATESPLPGLKVARRGLNIPTPESLVMVSRPKAWRVQYRRSICPSRATAIHSTFMIWLSIKTVAVP